jgi:cyanate permease
MQAFYVLGVLAAVLSATTAIDIAADRGRPGWAWALAGFALPLVAPVLVWLMPPHPRRFRHCAACAEWLRPAARVCPHCRSEVAQAM